MLIARDLSFIHILNGFVVKINYDQHDKSKLHLKRDSENLASIN